MDQLFLVQSYCVYACHSTVVFWDQRANMFSVVFTHPPPSHHGSVWLLPSETREGWLLLLLLRR
jgi:hypothetical protein